MNILKNDKVILIKPFGELQTVGDTFEVANITDTVIVLRNASTKIAACAIDIVSFEEYFKKLEEVKGWTNWQRLITQEEDTVAFYRTNGRKVQVRVPIFDTKIIRGESCCHKSELDKFNLYFGIKMAYKRATVKYFDEVIDQHLKEIRLLEDKVIALTAERANVGKSINQMINSLYKKDTEE